MSIPVRILHFSPGTATRRHDSHRACLGLLGFLRAEAREVGWDCPAEMVWALPTLTSRAAVHAALTGAEVLVVATPTYGQGSPWFVRKFFELSTGVNAWGCLATALATAGGQHTGGEVAVADTLRSLQGLGACTFTFAQKTVVLGTNQKFAPDGAFDLIDVWFLRQLARTILLQWRIRQEPRRAGEWAEAMGLATDYYLRFPTESALAGELGDWVQCLNGPLTQSAEGYAALSDKLGCDCRPPEADSLPFASLLPEPQAPLLS